MPSSPSLNTLQMTEEGSGSPSARGGGFDGSHRTASGSYFPSPQLDQAENKRRRVASGEYPSVVDSFTGWRKTYAIEGARGVRRRLQGELLLSRARFNQLPPIIKLVLIILGTGWVYNLLPPKAGGSSRAPLSHSSAAHSSTSLAAEVLTSAGGHSAIQDRKTGKYKGRSIAKTVENWSNPFGFVSTLELQWKTKTYDPTVLALPSTTGPSMEYLAVAQAGERFELVDETETRWRELVGGFFHVDLSVRLYIPNLNPSPNSHSLVLPADRVADYARCDNPFFDQFIGPEEPKLFFNADGAPLLMYSQTGDTPGICRGPFVVDARTVFPKLDSLLKKSGWAAPIEFAEQTSIVREGQANVEHNWVPFIGENDELWFAASAVPQMMYKYIPGKEALKAVQTSVSYSNCLTKVVGEQLDRAYHHATPLLKVTLCRRGECKPTAHNTVLFGIIHVKFPQDYKWYERRVVTYSTHAPYAMKSVSKPIIYSGTNGDDPLVTTSISWRHPLRWEGGGPHHGFLDDVLLVSYGAHDFQNNYIDVLARDLLTAHTMCDSL